MIKVSELAGNVKQSLTRKLFDMAKCYEDVIDFTLGDPDVQTHQDIKDAGCRAIQQGKTRYSQNAGLLELREAIADYVLRKEGHVVDPLSEIIVTVGAMEGLYLTLLSMLDPGDEVIIPAPYYVNYVQMVRMCHAVPVIVDSCEPNDLSVDAEQIRRSITPRTKAIMINTPSNPSGRIIPDETLKSIADLARQHDLVIISDEVYKCLIYDEGKFSSISTLPEMRQRTVLVNSLSKEFCMTGWRVGYVIAPAELVAAMTRLQENIVACAPLPSQYAAIQALSSDEDYSKDMVEIFSRRRTLLYKGLSEVTALKCVTPEATFYMMVDVSQTGMKSEEFAMALLQEQHVAVVPGVTYGQCCDDYVRIAFTIDEDKISEGIKRIAEFVSGLHK